MGYDEKLTTVLRFIEYIKTDEIFDVENKVSFLFLVVPRLPYGRLENSVVHRTHR